MNSIKNFQSMNIDWLWEKCNTARDSRGKETQSGYMYFIVNLFCQNRELVKLKSPCTSFQILYDSRARQKLENRTRMTNSASRWYMPRMYASNAYFYLSGISISEFTQVRYFHYFKGFFALCYVHYCSRDWTEHRWIYCTSYLPIRKNKTKNCLLKCVF